MSDIDSIIGGSLNNLINNPTLLSIFLGTLIGMFYYFGSIINANNWQYNNLNKQLTIYHGIEFLVTYVFFPIIIIYVLIIYIIGDYFDTVSFLKKIPIWTYFILIILLYSFLSKLDNWIYKKLINFDKPVYSSFGVYIGRLPDLRYLLFLTNYGIILGTKDLILRIFMIILDFLIISKFARLTNLHYQGAKAEIKLSSLDTSKIFRLIEFIEKGAFLKVQDKQTKKVFAIPTSNIEHMQLLEEEPLRLNQIFHKTGEDVSQSHSSNEET